MQLTTLTFLYSVCHSYRGCRELADYYVSEAYKRAKVYVFIEMKKSKGKFIKK